MAPCCFLHSRFNKQSNSFNADALPYKKEQWANDQLFSFFLANKNILEDAVLYFNQIIWCEKLLGCSAIIIIYLLVRRTYGAPLY
jgi:hypothetical protein